ncbi:ATP-binding protein [Roseitranquillus sediminis]|uniref:ATP-binding protein n=1 Tax=Roseitranquillus sediminis TaxID=2809051 RepID=UPI001D0C5875|nr:ATP-binding protein [Roseitranquillus sediminis]
MSIEASPLAIRIVALNLLALTFLVAGVLWAAPFRSSLLEQRAAALMTEARLTAALLEGGTLSSNDALMFHVDEIARISSADILIFDGRGTLLAMAEGHLRQPSLPGSRTYFTDALDLLWIAISDHRRAESRDPPTPSRVELARALADDGHGLSIVKIEGRTVLSASEPLGSGVVVLTSAAGEIDSMARAEREQVLRMFAVAVVVSIGSSLLLASTVATPLARLAEAAEAGRDRDARAVGANRVRIPDLTGRTDEIGRLSRSLKGMVAALYDRIDVNEQFAADVAHEIKNPLASMKSAVGAMRVASRPDQREKLLEVIEHDVGRLDRLVSDISSASRLDSELVREDEEVLDLTRMLSRLVEHFEREAAAKGVEVISDLPDQPVLIRGLEARLAQVVVNLVSNAISFCEEGDAIRIWARRRSKRVLIVVEDTGPGVPEEALDMIFRRFYSERPADQFGGHSGLGLAISKQIVEAHGGVIWAENIRPTQADVTSEPLGARFVVGLPG